MVFVLYEETVVLQNYIKIMYENGMEKPLHEYSLFKLRISRPDSRASDAPARRGGVGKKRNPAENGAIME